jgi:hypothetical protein
VDGSTEQIDSATYLHAAVATGIWLSTGLLLDAYLIATRRERLISDVFRTRLGKTVLAVFCLHVIDRLGRADPFKLAGAMVAARLVVTEAGAFVTELTEPTPDR